MLEKMTSPTLRLLKEELSTPATREVFFKEQRKFTKVLFPPQAIQRQFLDAHGSSSYDIAMENFFTSEEEAGDPVSVVEKVFLIISWKLKSSHRIQVKKP